MEQKIDHPKLEEAQGLLEHYKPEVEGICRIFGELAEAGDTWAFSFMVLTVQDILKQCFDRLNEISPQDGHTPNLEEFSHLSRW
jgi:hypothetical protein